MYDAQRVLADSADTAARAVGPRPIPPHASGMCGIHRWTSRDRARSRSSSARQSPRPDPSAARRSSVGRTSSSTKARMRCRASSTSGSKVKSMAMDRSLPSRARWPSEPSGRRVVLRFSGPLVSGSGFDATHGGGHHIGGVAGDEMPVAGHAHELAPGDRRRDAGRHRRRHHQVPRPGDDDGGRPHASPARPRRHRSRAPGCAVRPRSCATPDDPVSPTSVRSDRQAGWRATTRVRCAVAFRRPGGRGATAARRRRARPRSRPPPPPVRPGAGRARSGCRPDRWSPPGPDPRRARADVPPGGWRRPRRSCGPPRSPARRRARPRCRRADRRCCAMVSVSSPLRP